MNGEQLYNELKQAFDYLGSGFHGMGAVQVALDQHQLLLSFGNRKCAIQIPLRSDTKTKRAEE